MSDAGHLLQTRGISMKVQNILGAPLIGNRWRATLFSTAVALAAMPIGAIPALAAVPQAAAPATPATADPITKARVLAKNGQLSAAAIELKNFLRAYPNHAAGHAELASIFLLGNDGISSEKEWRLALQNGYPMDRVLDGLGASLMLQGQGPKLLKEFVASKYQGELKARVHLLRAQVHFSLSELEFAKNEVGEARKVAPNYFGVHIANARLKQIAGDLKGAEGDIDAALKIAPGNVDAQLLKGELLGGQGNLDGALAQFNAVLATNRTDLRARLGRVATLISQQKNDAAEADVDEVLKKAPGSPLAAYFKAQLLAGKGKRAQALALLTGVQGMERLPAALYLLAALHLEKGDVEQAQKYISAYVAKVPDDARGELLMVSLRLARGEVAAALPKLEEIKSKLPNDYASSLLLGNAYLSLGRFADATTQFQAASNASPSALEASTGLAQSLLAQGKSDEGAKILQGLVSDGKGTARTTALLVLSHLQKKDFDSAFKAVAEYAVREPKNPAAPYLRSSLNGARGDRAAMRKDLQDALALDAKFIPAELALAQIDRADGKRDQAQKHYQNILGHAPASIEAYVGLAALSYDANDKAASQEWLKKAIAANPTAVAPRLLTVNFLLTEGKAAEAVKAGGEFVQKFPTNPLAIDAMGSAQLANGDFRGASASFGKLLTMQQGSVAARVKLAWALRGEKKFDEAVQNLEAALKINPASVDAHRALVDLTYEREGPAAAIKKAQEAQSALTDKTFASLLLADTQRAAGKFSEAEAIYKAVWKKSPTPALLAAYTQSMEAQGKYEASRTVITQWLKVNPNDASAKFALMVNSIASGRYKDALSEGLILQKDRPADVALLNNLAWLYDKTGDLVKAVQLAEQAYSQSPRTPEVADTLGWLLVRSQKLDRGSKYLKAAYEMAPRNPEIAYHHAFVLKQAGKAAEAKTILAAALQNPQPFAERKDAEKFLATLN
jgi:putative PEP-CTERM system TPR-repeat lipoprotein